MYAVAARIGENLHLDMSGLLQIFFQQHRVIAEPCFRLPSRRGQRRRKVRRALDDAHAFATASGRRLDQLMPNVMSGPILWPRGTFSAESSSARPSSRFTGWCHVAIALAGSGGSGVMTAGTLLL